LQFLAQQLDLAIQQGRAIPGKSDQGVVLKKSKPTVNVVFAFCLGLPNGPNASGLLQHSDKAYFQLERPIFPLSASATSAFLLGSSVAR